MLRFSSWTVGAIIAICIAGVVFSLPNLFPREQMQRMPSWLPHQQISLGLDLQGGSHLLLEVGVDTVVEERMESVTDDVRRILRPERVKYRGLGAKGNTTSFTLVDSAQASKALEVLAQLNSNPVTPDFEISRAGSRIDITLTDTAAAALKSNAVQQSVEIVRRRIDEVGTREPTIQQ
ncbi:MAG: protein translocase subunit SecD, partial [Geminicoccaceae bacterium]